MALSVVQVPGLRGKSWRTHTDKEGHFTFSYLPDGIYLLARRGGGKGGGKMSLDTLARYVRIAGSKRHQVVLTAAGGARLLGTVTAAGDLPSYLFVRLTPQYPEGIPWEERQPPQQTSATTGSFTFDGLGPGRYRVDVYGKVGPPVHGNADIEIAGIDERRIEVRLTERSGR